MVSLPENLGEPLMPYMAHGVSPVSPKVDVVSLDSGEASLAAGPPRPEALWKFLLKEKCSLKIFGGALRGHFISWFLKQYGHGSK